MSWLDKYYYPCAHVPVGLIISMKVPLFIVQNVQHKLIAEGIAAAFPIFVAEIYRKKYPSIKAFQTSGKDGCIDLLAEIDNYRLVMECKFTESNDSATFERAWKDVETKLFRNLTPDVPLNGQGQYRPWYNDLAPITQFYFVTSAPLKNANNLDALKNAINDCFKTLSTRSGLSHLKDINVHVIDWTDIEILVLGQPILAFKWFPSVRPTGLVPLCDAPKVSGFRSYLQGNHLPYYHASQHVPLPPPEMTLFKMEVVLRIGE